MDAAQCALSSIERQAALHEPGIQLMTLEFLLAPSAGKEPTFVNRRDNVKVKDSWQFGLIERQGAWSALPDMPIDDCAGGGGDSVRQN